jgi:hypothetical protein
VDERIGLGEDGLMQAEDGWVGYVLTIYCESNPKIKIGVTRIEYDKCSWIYCRRREILR